MRPEFTVRIGTQDPQAFREVLCENCYRLPDSFNPGDRIIDVGANIGSFTVACLARGAGFITAVEPHPDNFDLLVRNTKRWVGQLNYLRAAVYWRGMEWVSIQDRGPFTAMHCVGTSEGQGIAVTAPRTTLDQLIVNAGSAQNQRVRLLKLDCEGGEYPGVFEANRLAVCQEIIVECHPVKMEVPEESGPVLRQLAHPMIVAALEAKGFEVTAVEPDKLGNNHVVWARNKKA